MSEVPDAVLLARVTVPFDEHPEIYSRLQYGAVVVTGTEFSALASDGQTIKLD